MAGTGNLILNSLFKPRTMITQIKNCSDLTDILLNVIRKKPGMFLGKNNIWSLSTFLNGYEMATMMYRDNMDSFYSENGFKKWFLTIKNAHNVSFWEIPLIEEAEGDETKALELFFNYLEEYQNSIK